MGGALAERCRDPESDPDTMRQVFISDYRDPLNAARAYVQTEDFRCPVPLICTLVNRQFA